ncbi:MAG: TRAM domain-containing protein [Armatimonadetes bacterium]|nr:TRAM domain-containing protein [Armatimonadota bacterium]
MVSGRRVRPLFTLVFAVLGSVAGYAIATQYLFKLQQLIGTDNPHLGPIPINPTKLKPSEETALYTVFIVVGALFGFILERIAFSQAAKARSNFETMAPHDKIASGIGLITGLILTALIVSILGTPLWVNAVMAVVLCYLTVAALDSLKEQIRFYFPSTMPAVKGERKAGCRPKILDTNVIIDGRISDISRAGFMEGPIYVPRFVLDELQQIADSSDSLKRARGRRGLDILNQMQKEMDLSIPEFVLDDPNEEVDARLVLAAREVGGAIVTNDYNLNRVAELQGVAVLNINELANALKPVVLPGEEMRVTITREGKEKEQGIGYLDDGTMIVVEGARRLIGETLFVSVTSVLQTVQGKMIFGKVKENGEQSSEPIENSIRTYTGGRPRRKIQ